MEHTGFEEKISRVFSLEIQRLADEIAWVDKRLLEIDGDSSDEAIAERMLLRALRNHLINDLRELGGFSGDPYLFELESETLTGAEAVDEAYGYS